jgi:hypothetical protein
MLTVLTTKFDCQNLRFKRSIQQVSCTFLVLIKFHELCCDFHGQVRILREIGTNVPHGLGTAEPQGTASPADVAGPAGAAGPAKCGRTFPVARAWSNPPPLPRAQLG